MEVEKKDAKAIDLNVTTRNIQTAMAESFSDKRNIKAEHTKRENVTKSITGKLVGMGSGQNYHSVREMDNPALHSLLLPCRSVRENQRLGC